MDNKSVLTILLGSPRIGGNTDALACALEDGAKEKGIEVRNIRMASLNINGCLGCHKCWTTGKPCIQNDDIDKLYKNIEECNVVAFVSPLFFYSFSTQIKPAWDRLLAFYSKASPRTLKKKTLLLAACGDAEEYKFDGMKISFKLATEFLGWENLGEICVPGMHGINDMKELGSIWLEKAKELGKSL